MFETAKIRIISLLRSVLENNSCTNAVRAVEGEGVSVGIIHSELTYLLVVSWGLIAGLSLPEINRMRPGQVMDLYIYRRNYDDVQHGVIRK